MDLNSKFHNKNQEEEDDLPKADGKGNIVTCSLN